MTDAENLPATDPVEDTPPPQPPQCRRCGAPGPVDDDGFCAPCEKALEQACL